MASRRNINELVRYLKKTNSLVIKGAGLALIKITQDAEAEAKKNSTEQFKGRNNRRLSGRLLNSIYSGFDVPRNPKGTTLATSFVGVRGIPYGAIHEFGGLIRPVKAKNLWIKAAEGNKVGRFKRLTPREFMDLRKKAKLKARAKTRLAMKGLGPRQKGRSKVSRRTTDESFEFIGKMAAHVKHLQTKDKITPLFWLAQRVNMPARPYVGPAIKAQIKRYPIQTGREIGKLLRQKLRR